MTAYSQRLMHYLKMLQNCLEIKKIRKPEDSLLLLDP